VPGVAQEKGVAASENPNSDSLHGLAREDPFHSHNAQAKTTCEGPRPGRISYTSRVSDAINTIFSASGNTNLILPTKIT
jgi:hypothetical protein